MLKIVHFAKYYAPDAGGIESVTVSLAEGAVEAGYSVSVVCFAKTHVNSEGTLKGVRVIRAPVATLVASQPLGFRYFFCCLLFAKKADLVHLHLPNMLGAFCALFTPARTQVLVHWHSDVLNKGILGKIFGPLESAVLRRANSIVTTSQVYADASATLGPYRSKVIVVPIGVQDVLDRGNISQIPPNLEGKIGKKKIVLGVGRLVPYKGFDVLIEATRQLAEDAVVVIVGGGVLQDALCRAVENSGVKDRIFMAGNLTDTELQALFERATLFCLPSMNRAEAFGVVLLEAMAYGLPIVASDIPGSGVPWVNRHGVSGFNVPVGNAAAVAEACNKILTSERTRRRLSQGARKRFINEFTASLAVDRMLTQYKKLTAGAKL